MSSASKSTKSTKSNTKSNTKTEPEMDKQDKHSVFNGNIKKKPDVAKFCLDLFNGLNTDLLDKDSVDIIINYAFGEPLESLEKLVKENDSKTKKEKKKKETVFEAVGLTKVRNAIDIFGDKFYADAKEKGIKFNKENNPLTCKKKAWDELSEKEKDKYKKQSLLLKETYDIEYEKQKAEAIKNGLFRNDELKKPLKDIDIFGLLFSKESKEKNIKFSKDNNYLVARKKAWDALSEKEKAKYSATATKAKSEYDIKKAQWDETEQLRIEKQSGKPVEIKIESSGNSDKKKSTKSKASKETDSEAEAEADDEERGDIANEIVNEVSDEEEQVAPKGKAANKSKKTETKKSEPKEAKEAKKSEPKEPKEPKKSKSKVKDVTYTSETEEVEETVKVPEVKTSKKTEGKKKSSKVIAIADEDEDDDE